MKRILKVLAIIFVLLSGTSLENVSSAQVSASISFQAFYDDLSPYGRWVDYPEYGYVWCPDVGSGFRPYSTMGHWEWSDDYDWIWVSDYDWGWAPFHYGRWFYDPFYGWMWMPGYEWAPAWVVWRSGGDFYGWAPLRPGINVGINFSIGSYSPPNNYWCFAPRRYITSPRIFDYCISPRRNEEIIRNTLIINSYNYGHHGFLTGPLRNEAERYCGRIIPVRFREMSRPGRTEFRNNEVAIYRPGIQRVNNRRFSPRSFSQYNKRPQNNNAFGRNNFISNHSNNLPQRQQRYNQSQFNQRNNSQANKNYSRNFNHSQISRNNNNFINRNYNRPNRNFQRNTESHPFNYNRNQSFSRGQQGQPHQFINRNNGSYRGRQANRNNNGDNGNRHGRNNRRG